MEDTQIIELYLARNEEALTRTSEKYGGLCMSIAQRILNSRPDSEECVNDTWLGAWNSIPPAEPLSLSAFLGRLTRNIAIDRLRRSYCRCGSADRSGILDIPGELPEQLH